MYFIGRQKEKPYYSYSKDKTSISHALDSLNGANPTVQPSRTLGENDFDVFLNGKHMGYLFLEQQSQIDFLIDNGVL